MAKAAELVRSQKDLRRLRSDQGGAGSRDWEGRADLKENAVRGSREEDLRDWKTL